MRGRGRDDATDGPVGIKHQTHVGRDVLGRERLRAHESLLLGDREEHAHPGMRFARLGESTSRLDHGRHAHLVVTAEHGIAGRADHAAFEHRLHTLTRVDTVHVRRERDTHGRHRAGQRRDEVAGVRAGEMPGLVEADLPPQLRHLARHVLGHTGLTARGA